jgi:hypothetical protein
MTIARLRDKTAVLRGHKWFSRLSGDLANLPGMHASIKVMG